MFTILEHTADTGFEAWGESDAQLFENASLALQSIAIDAGQAGARYPYPIAAAGEDYESLLVAWLNEVLYYIDGQRVVMNRFEIDRIDAREAVGKGWGEPLDPERHPPRMIVKGVTYHQLEVREEDGRWRARVFLDV